MTLTDQIKQSISTISGLSWQEIISSNKRWDAFYVRMIISERLKNLLKPSEIAKIVNRNRTTIYYYQKQYYEELYNNREFRELSDKI